MKRGETRKMLKKILSIALSAAILVSGITIMPATETEVYAAATIKDINLEFGGIGDPTSTTEGASEWAGSKVYYGENANIWLVLDDSGFLFSESSIGTRQYHSNSNTWSTSDLRDYLNDESDDDTFLNTNFTATEQDAIEKTSVQIESYNGSSVVDTSEDYIFLLSVSEVQNTTYGFGSDATRGIDSWWWLRSPGSVDFSAACVDDSGSVPSNGNLVYSAISVRPAFNLNLDSVLFTSASGASKSSFGVVGSGNVSANTWKLTLKDGDEAFAATLPTVGTAGSSITVIVETAGVVSGYTQTSAILSDASGTVVAYGKIGEVGIGNKSLTIPSTITAGTYTLHVFEEQVNSGNLTDYASKVVTTNITISEPPTYDVAITVGTNMTKTTDSGNASQTGVVHGSAITAVVYTAYEGYYFPETYSVTSDNGISVARNSFTQITVSGTPTDNATITLADATAKGNQSTPTGLSDGVDKIAGTTTAMEYILQSTYNDDNTAGWATCSASNTTVVAGTYYVRYAETDTLLAGTRTTVIVTAAPTYTVTVNNGTGDGSYIESASVTITANAAPSGQHFKEWTGADSLTFTSGSKSSATAVFTMPASVVTLTATYENDTTGTTSTTSTTNTTSTTGATDSTSTTYIPPAWEPTDLADIYRYSLSGPEDPLYKVLSNVDSIRMVKDVQGPLFFNAIALVQGDYTLARTYNIFVNNTLTYYNGNSVKIELQIPESLQMEGRTFRMFCVTQDGAIVSLSDLDNDPTTITFETDQFYAFTLAYVD